MMNSATVGKLMLIMVMWGILGYVAYKAYKEGWF